MSKGALSPSPKCGAVTECHTECRSSAGLAVDWLHSHRTNGRQEIFQKAFGFVAGAKGGGKVRDFVWLLGCLVVLFVGYTSCLFCCSYSMILIHPMTLQSLDLMEKWKDFVSKEKWQTQK